MKALGRGISAPPGLRSFSFRVQANGNGNGASGSGNGNGVSASGQWLATQAEAVAVAAAAAAAWEGQEQRAPARLVVQPPLLWYGNGSSSSSGSGSLGSLVSASLDFVPTAQESRRWQFALLQPAPGLVSALCVERRLPAAGHCERGGEDEGMRLLSFEAAGPWGGQERPADTLVLAVGQYEPS